MTAKLHWRADLMAGAVVAVLLYGYAFPELDRKWLTLILAVGWIAAEIAAWWWVRYRRKAKKKTSTRKRV